MTGPDLGGHGQSLAGLVKYQTGSVVSRSLVNRSAGSVTLFAFDAAQGLSEHTTPYAALAFVLEGELEITIAGDRGRLSQGEVVLMPADVPHAVDAVSRSKMLLVMLRD